MRIAAVNSRRSSLGLQRIGSLREEPLQAMDALRARVALTTPQVNSLEEIAQRNLRLPRGAEPDRAIERPEHVAERASLCIGERHARGAVRAVTTTGFS